METEIIRKALLHLTIGSQIVIRNITCIGGSRNKSSHAGKYIAVITLRA